MRLVGDVRRKQPLLDHRSGWAKFAERAGHPSVSHGVCGYVLWSDDHRHCPDVRGHNGPHYGVLTFSREKRKVTPL